MRPATIKKLVSQYARAVQKQGEKSPEFYSGVLIGPPCPQEPVRESRYANEERWDWWRVPREEPGN